MSIVVRMEGCIADLVKGWIIDIPLRTVNLLTKGKLFNNVYKFNSPLLCIGVWTYSKHGTLGLNLDSDTAHSV